MTLPSTKTFVRGCFLFVAISFFTSAFAAKPPPGVPRKNICAQNLVAVKVVDLEFGDYDGTVAGTITVTPGGTRSTSGPNLVGNSFNAAAFDVSNALANCNYYPIRIQIQGVPTDLTGPGIAMPADIFTSTPTGIFTLSPTPGVPTRVYVGATLTSGATQAGGAYTTAAPFTMRFSHRNP